MDKISFSNYTPRQNGLRSLEEATAEIQREMDVRKRLFDRWVTEGKLSWVDAKDRLERHMSALVYLFKLSELEQKALNFNHNTASADAQLDPQNSFDAMREAVTS